MSNSEESRQRMEALTQANLRLLKRVNELEKRVAKLEGAPEPIAEPEPPIVPLPTSVDIPPPAAPASPDVETKVGLAWINRIAVVTCIFAAAFFFKYAADNQWIGPSGRVLLGLLAGLASIFFGERFHRKGQRTYAQGLCGLGAALLFLSVYAAHGFYGLIPLSAAFVLMVASIALAGSLAMRYDSPAIAVLALLGGFLTPLLLATGSFHPGFYGYLLLLSAAACWLARNRNWRVIELLALAGVFVLTVASIEDMMRANAEGYLLAFLCAAFALFIFSPVTAVFYLAELIFPVTLFATREAGALAFIAALLGMTAVSLWLGGKARRTWTLPLAYLAATLCIVEWIESLPSIFPVGQTLPAAFGLFVFFLMWIPWRLREGDSITNGHLTVAALSGLSFFAVVLMTLDPQLKQWEGAAALFTAAVFALAGRLCMANARAALLNFGMALGFITLAAPLQFERFSITMAWALEAAALSWIAARTGSMKAGYLSLAVFALAAFSLGNNYDDRMRIWSYLSVSAAMWFAAHSLKSFPTLPRLAAIPYVVGHLVMFAGLGHEIAGWARRNAAPEDVASVASLGLSLLLAVWAVGLISAGVALQSVLNRIFGLAVTGFVIAKLYLYDVWNLGVFYRVIAFAALGGTLLLTSFLYSRYRAKIESLWQGDNR